MSGVTFFSVGVARPSAADHPSDCHVLREINIEQKRGILWCGRGAGGAKAGLDGCVSRLKLLLAGFECQQTRRKIHSEKCQRYLHAVLIVNKTY